MSISSVKTGAIGVSLLAGNAYYLPSDYESIATVSVGSGGTSTISFTSIPSTFSHLQLRYFGHLQGNGFDFALTNVTFNNDSGSNYAYHRLYGSGSSASADGASSQTKFYSTWTPDNLSQANSFGSAVIDILDYANTNKYKTARILGGFDLNGSGYVALFSGLWQSTSAINRIDIVSNSGQSFSNYSHFALYGIKA